MTDPVTAPVEQPTPRDERMDLFEAGAELAIRRDCEREQFERADREFFEEL